MIEWLEQRGQRPAADQLQAARLAVLAAALLGRAVPDPVRRRQAEDRAGFRAARCSCPSSTTSSRAARPKGRSRRPPLGSRRKIPTPAGSRGARRTRCRNGPGRAGTTCGSSIPTTRERLVDPRARALLDAGRPLHRRRRARGAASALCAVLAQGALRPRASCPRPSRSRSSCNQGMILGELEFTGYVDARGNAVSAEVVRAGPRHAHERARHRAERGRGAGGEARRALRAAASRRTSSSSRAHSR